MTLPELIFCKISKYFFLIYEYLFAKNVSYTGKKHFIFIGVIDNSIQFISNRILDAIATSETIVFFVFKFVATK